ncbi:MAG: response regulator [Eubacteriales bacterium]|nr:response regulator [Eubacteriales bacterium]
MNILICDDEYYVRKALSKCIGKALERCGVYNASLVECSCAEDALDVLKNQPVDIIFTDIQMGKLNGIDFCFQISEQYPDVKTVIISGHADFEYAQKAITAKVASYLLKPVDEEELFNLIESLLTLQLRENPDSSTSLPIPPDIASFCNIDLKNNECYIVILFRSNEIIFDETLFTEIQHQLSEDGLNIRVIYRADDRTIMLLPVFPVQTDKVHQYNELLPFLYRYHKIISETANVSLSVGISAFYMNLSVFSYAYEEAKSQMTRYEISEYYSDYKKTVSHTSSVYLDIVTQKLISYYIKCMKIESLKDILFQNMEKQFAQNILTPVNCYQYVLEVIQFILFSALDENVRTNLNYQINMEELVQLGNASACQQYLCDFLQVIEESSGNLSQEKIIKKLTEYLNEHYSEDISLSDIAQNIFYVHPNYLSKVLKNNTGKSFSKYLLSIRMEKARELLIQDSTLSVSIISQLVGFNSESYFVQTFRKYYGQTPGGYRKDQ